MDINQPSRETVRYMFEAITTKLRVANAQAMSGDNFSLDKFEDLRDLYEMVESKSSFSISEIEAIVTELGRMR
jgi:uncharacterized protein YfkK (UPF0435 family)